MYQRKEITKRIVTGDGGAINLRYLNGLTIEDVLQHKAQAFAYTKITGVDKATPVKRETKDILIKLYTLS